jgi:hypothetical protein
MLMKEKKSLVSVDVQIYSEKLCKASRFPDQFCTLTIPYAISTTWIEVILGRDGDEILGSNRSLPPISRLALNSRDFSSTATVRDVA